MGPLENLQVKADGCEKQKSGRKYYKIAYRKNKNLSYSHLLPQGVVGGLWGSGVDMGATDGLLGLQMASRATGGFMGL